MPKVKEPVIDAAAAAQGIGLPPAAEQEAGNEPVYVHDRPQAPERGIANAYFRFVAMDDRENYVRAKDQGARFSTEEEARTAGIQKGQKGPDGIVRWGGLGLMIMKKDKREERKAREKAENLARIKRSKESLAEETRRIDRDHGGPGAVFGDVKITG